MSGKGKLRTAIFWMMLAVGQMMGAPLDPKKIAEIQHIMNRPNVEVILEKDDAK